MKKADYGDGCMFQRGKRGTWYVRYSVNSKAFTERAVNESGRPVETEREAKSFSGENLTRRGLEYSFHHKPAICECNPCMRDS